MWEGTHEAPCGASPRATITTRNRSGAHEKTWVKVLLSEILWSRKSWCVTVNEKKHISYGEMAVEGLSARNGLIIKEVTCHFWNHSQTTYDYIRHIQVTGHHSKTANDHIIIFESQVITAKNSYWSVLVNMKDVVSYSLPSSFLPFPMTSTLVPVAAQVKCSNFSSRSPSEEIWQQLSASTSHPTSYDPLPYSPLLLHWMAALA